ncbi:hypothetical protein M433DRAFT_2143 [Acidomyces richmondensis BFW]|nr:hypothetical protein M433DRAFT_2143 [Acidomyces richmondensis BFW]
MPKKTSKVKATRIKANTSKTLPTSTTSTSISTTTTRGRDIAAIAALTRPRRSTIDESETMAIDKNSPATVTEAKSALTIDLPDASNKNGENPPNRPEELPELPAKKRGRQSKNTEYPAGVIKTSKKRGCLARAKQQDAEDDDIEEDAIEIGDTSNKRRRTSKRKQKDSTEEEDDEVTAEAAAEIPKKRSPAAKVKLHKSGTEDDEEATGDKADLSKERGRPAKAKLQKSGMQDEETAIGVANISKKRGHPVESNRQGTNKEAGEESITEVAQTPKRRGRPAKFKSTYVEHRDGDCDFNGQAAEGRCNTGADSKKKYGRDAAASKEEHTATARPAPAVLETEKRLPKISRCLLKSGETNRIGADDEAVARKLEAKLVNATEEYNSKTAAPLKRSGSVTQGKAVNAKRPDVDADGADKEGSGDRQYWLMKAEQEDREETAPDGSVVNTKFTIDDLHSKTEPEMWDGVRNFVAAKNMRAMRIGDLAFFYASGGKQGRKPGIVGIMEIVYEARPDPSVSDRSSIYYRPGEEERWCVVGVEFRQKLDKPVWLAELQKYGKENGPLEGMQLFTQTRLSVSKVQAKEWRFITEKLIADYPGDDALTRGVWQENKT